MIRRAAEEIGLKCLANTLDCATSFGETENGSLGGGDDSFYDLPSGKSINVGFIDIRRYDGVPWEWLGIAPDVRIEQTEADIIAGRDKQLEYAIEFLK